MEIKLTKKKAVISGSTAGIGHAIAKGLARAGASVLVNGTAQKRVQALLFFGVRAFTLVLIIGAASGLSVVFPVPTLAFPLNGFVGVALILASKILDYESIKAFWAAGGTFFYTRPPKRLVDTGPYNHVRNPLYLTLLTDTLGLFLIFGSVLYLVILILFIVGIDRIVITREEAQLGHRFGNAYLDYKTRVPRWIPRILSSPQTNSEP